MITCHLNHVAEISESFQFNFEIIKNKSDNMNFNCLFYFHLQGVSCDIFDGFWHVTVLNIGPIHDNSLICSDEKLEFRPELFNLKYLKVLSFFNCFQSPTSLPVSIPTGNWEKSCEILESIEFRSNPGLIGNIINIPFLICGFLNIPFARILQNCQSQFMIAQDKSCSRSLAMVILQKLVREG